MIAIEEGEQRKDDENTAINRQSKDTKSVFSRLKSVCASIAIIGFVKAILKLVIFFYDLASKL